MSKLSSYPQESSFASTDFLLRIALVGAGDKLITLADFKTAIGTGYAIQLMTGGAGHNPADNTTRYFGNGVSILQSAGLNNLDCRTFIPKAGTLTAVYGVVQVNGTLGSTETVTMNIRVNDTTSYLVTNTLQFSAQFNPFNSTNLNSGSGIPLSVGDFIGMEFVTPAWVTNPTTVWYQATVFVSY